MERVSFITFFFLLMISCLHGAPVNHKFHTGDANTDSKTIATVDCPKNCTFVITKKSLSNAKKDFAKFLNLKRSMLVYVNINSHNLTLLPVNDQQKQNQMREWQWIMSTNSWYINLPIDLEYTSFHVTYSGESRIRLKVEAIESNCCSISDAGIEQVRNLLWSDLFTNRSGSLLCNRYFDHQEWKSTFYAFTTVWIGYDLLCRAPTIDKSYQQKSHAAASVLAPIFCFFIALYHPLINKIIENRYIKRQLKEVKNSKGEMELYDYIKGDKPFGYERMVLKCFFSRKFTKCSPAIKLNIMYFNIYLIFNTVPMMLEHYLDKEELEDFNSIYKLGLPVFHYPVFHYVKPNKCGYACQIWITTILLLLVSIANFWYFKELSDSTDFLLFLKFPNRLVLCEDVDRIIEILKTRRNNYKGVKNVRKRRINSKTGHVQKHNKGTAYTIDASINSVYSKFIKRFTLLFSLGFWKYIFDHSTKISYDSHSKSNEDKEHLCRRIQRCLICFIGLIIVFPINFILIILTCAFPVFWFVMFPFLNRIKKSLSCLETFFCKACQKCKQKISIEEQTPLKPKSDEQTKKNKDMDSTTKKNDPTMVENNRCTCNEIFYLILDIPCIFLLYHQFSVIVFILRSIVYILFIVITNYDHLLRIFIVVTSCFAYLGMFIAKFIDRYAAILKIIFDEFEKKIIIKSEDCSKIEKEEETIFVSEECFDYVIDHCYAVREHFFVVIFKIVITIMFLILSLAVLLQSNIFDSTTKLTYIIGFVFIVVNPSVVFTFFDKDEQAITHDQKRDIRQRTNDYYEQLQEEESEEDTEETRIKDYYEQLQEDGSEDDTGETRSFEDSCNSLSDSLYMSCRSRVSRVEEENRTLRTGTEQIKMR